jgi:hypothetical protein
MPPEEFDVFLCHNSKDKDFILEIYNRLLDRGIQPWIDDDLIPGRRSLADLAQQIRQVRSVAVFVGKHGIGRWQQQEIDLAIAENTKRGMPVIPVWLEDAPDGFEMPHFLENFTWVDFRQTRLDPFERLVKGIPADTKTPPIPQPNKAGLKPGAPDPRVRLPKNYVDRPDAINTVKSLLLSTEKTVVVSAIAGLGGLGKSVLAAAIVLDEAVRSRFCDGILWVTLGQNPDLLGLLGDWIRALDKSRESYAATTLEAASRYLQTLVAERRMLLVVDDVWNGAHVEYFRVGGADCRVLVTTREAQIEGAEAFALDWMTEEEAIALVSKKLGRAWREEQVTEVKAFARSLGYLPLALDLSANLVRDGLSWVELRSEFEAERRAVALEVLDATEAFQHLAESEQRKYSLRACFNLSLRRLTAEQLRQFAWLGVLPEDVRIDGRMAVTLWDLPQLRAKRLLIEFWRRSLLTRVEENGLGEMRYRVHDLMHDTARGLIEQGTLGEGIQNLSSAHGQLLERYRSRGSWYRLVNDGYIYRHLTWHLVQAEWESELHELLAMSDELGRNAWFEACDRIGEPGIFVQDVKRGWEVAEQLYERDGERAIVLQCRYALVTGTLNSLVEQLPSELIAAFVRGGLWTTEQAWAYVEQMQDEIRVARATVAIAPYLSPLTFELAMKKGRSIQNKYWKAMALSSLTQIDRTYTIEALQATQLVQYWRWRTDILIVLAQAHRSDQTRLLEAVEAIQDKARRSEALAVLSQTNKTDDSQAPKTHLISDGEPSQIEDISNSVQVNVSKLVQTLEAVRSIQDENSLGKALIALTQIDETFLADALEIVQLIHDQGERAELWSDLAQINRFYFAEAWDNARKIRFESKRASVLSALAGLGKTSFEQLWEAINLIQDESRRSRLQHVLTQIDEADFMNLCLPTREGGSAYERVWSTLSQINGSDFDHLLKADRSIQIKPNATETLNTSHKVDRACFIQALNDTALSTFMKHSNNSW